MRRILAVTFTLVLWLGLAPMATAGHSNDACHISGLLVTNDMGVSCPMILNCPATSLTCSWDVTVAAQGLGHVRAYLIVLGTGQKVVTCGPDPLECSHTEPFHLSPTEVVNAECWIFGGDSHPALLPSLECTAVAVGHVG